MAEKTFDNESINYMREIVKFLEAAGSEYDKGSSGEAIRLANCVRVLVHSDGESRSLLDRMDLMKLAFYDGSPDYDSKLGLPFSGLAIVTLGGKTQKYVPRLDTNLRIQFSPFAKFWTKPVIVDEENNINLNREAIILAVSKSRVGVLASTLTGQYDNIMVKANLPDIEAAHIPAAMLELEYASARQIAFELMVTLNEQCGDLLQLH
ncbi:MAG: hypothetical protein HY954_08480 [Deltaproteobacteria bacterium]|nr:hypothetical protein [Deltaproteobacteria bacterium]